MSFNKITIVGNLGRNPEVKFTPQGQQVCEFSVATNEKRANDQVETTWFHVSLWGKLAETCSEYLYKGREVYVEGRLRTREWTDREGQKRFSLEVNATDLKLLGNRSETTSHSQEVISQNHISQAEKVVEVAPAAVTREEVLPPKSTSKAKGAKANGKVTTVKDPFAVA